MQVRQIIHQLDKAFENRVRLGIMSALMVNEEVYFTGLRDLLDVSDGNLASHLKALEKTGYVESSKQFVGRKPNTTYKATGDGKRAFQKHLETLEKLIQR